jgi:hypothetical protein
MNSPFALTPAFVGPRQPHSDAAAYGEWAKSWTVPFVMAPIDTRNVHRTHVLRGHPWGRDFIYDECTMTGDGAKGESRARRLARAMRVQNALLGFAPTRALLRRFMLRKRHRPRQNRRRRLDRRRGAGTRAGAEAAGESRVGVCIEDTVTAGDR